MNLLLHGLSAVIPVNGREIDVVSERTKRLLQGTTLVIVVMPMTRTAIDFDWLSPRD